MTRRIIPFTALVLAGALSFGPSARTPAAAQGLGSSFDADQAREAVKTGRTVPLARIQQDLRKRYGGSMMDADLYAKSGGSSEYSIKWIDRDGRRLIILVDAQSGRVVRESRG